MDAKYDGLARCQLGLVTTAQLRESGWSAKATRLAVATGRLIPVRKGVFRPAGAAVTREQAWMAAVLAAAPGAVVSHGTAARLWGLPGFADPDTIDLLVEGDRRSRVEGVTGHRTASLPAGHRSVRRGVPVTSAERTLVDTCSLVPAPVLETAVDHALRVGDAHLPRLVRVVAEAPATGPGSLQPIRAVLADRVAGYDPGDSRRELDLVKLLAGAGFEPPTQQVRVRVEGRTYFVDAAWPALKVGFEYDSVRFHHSVSAFHRDRERLRRLQRAGWAIWPVTSRTSADEILAIATLAFGRVGVGGG